MENLIKIIVIWISVSCLGCANGAKTEQNTKAQTQKEHVARISEVSGSGALAENAHSVGNTDPDTALNYSNNQALEKSSQVIGKDVIKLSDFGATGNQNDETEKIQRALNAAVGKILLIPRQRGKYYLSGQLVVPSNIEIQFEEGVEFLAKDDLNQKIRTAESLFRFEESENVVFDGNGVVLKMNKSKYLGEHNHLIMINGAKNITIKNVNALNSGGDGFYVGAAWTKRIASEDIRFYNCVAKNNRRQGMSVISVDGLLVENSEFSHTQGTLPEAGVDIEPGQPNYILNNIHFKNCIAEGNKGRGFQVVLIKSGPESNSIDVTFENCKAVGNDIGFSNRYFAEGSKGTVRMVNCISEDSRGPGFWEGSCAASGALKEYKNCVSINSGVDLKSATVKNAAGFGVSNFATHHKKVLGNSNFIDCKTIDNRNSSLMEYGFSMIDRSDFDRIVVSGFISSGHRTREIEMAPNEKGIKATLAQ